MDSRWYAGPKLSALIAEIAAKRDNDTKLHGCSQLLWQEWEINNLSNEEAPLARKGNVDHYFQRQPGYRSIPGRSGVRVFRSKPGRFSHLCSAISAIGPGCRWSSPTDDMSVSSIMPGVKCLSYEVCQNTRFSAGLLHVLQSELSPLQPPNDIAGFF